MRRKTLMVIMMVVCIVLSGTAVFALDSAETPESAPQTLESATPSILYDADSPMPAGTASPGPAEPTQEPTEDVTETPSAEATATDIAGDGEGETPAGETAEPTQDPIEDAADEAETPSEEAAPTDPAEPADADGAEDGEEPPARVFNMMAPQGAASPLFQEADPAAVQEAAVSMETVNFHVTNSFTKYIEAASIAVGGQTVATNAIGDAPVLLAPGTYFYTVNADGYNPVSGQFVVEAGQPCSVAVVMTPVDADLRYTVALQVWDGAGGLPISNATVYFEGAPLPTDASGTVVLQVLYPGTYTVAAAAPGFYQAAYTFTLMDSDISHAISLERDVTPAPEPTPAASPRPRPAASYINQSTSGSGSSSSGNASGDSKDEKDDLKELDEDEEEEEETPTPSPTPTPVPTATPTPTPTPEPEKQTYNIGLNIAYLDGAPAADIPLELHSDVISARTDEGGYAYFQGVEEGAHTLYVKDAQGNVVAEKAFTLSSGVKTALDITNVSGDQVYVGMGVDTVTVDSILDNDLLVLTAVVEGEHPSTVETGGEATPAAEDNNLIWMLVVSVSAAAVAVIILLVAIRRMKRSQAVDVHSNGNGADAALLDDEQAEEAD